MLGGLERAFAGLAGVDGWRQEGDGACVLMVSEPSAAAPAVTRALVAVSVGVLSSSQLHRSLEDVHHQLIDTDGGLDAPWGA